MTNCAGCAASVSSRGATTRQRVVAIDSSSRIRSAAASVPKLKTKTREVLPVTLPPVEKIG